MVKHLIIDAYNLLGARGMVRAQRGSSSESVRENLIKELALYRQRKSHPLTVVFDGWQQGLGTERHEHRAGLEVIYSRRGERADQVIQRLAHEYGSDCAVVSSDREVADFARSTGAFVMGAVEFDLRLRESVSGQSRHAPPRKFSEKDSDLPRHRPEKKGNPKKLPKAARKRLRQLKAF